MLSSNNSEIEKLKIIYYEIICGYTLIPSLNIYVKHFTEMDNIEITQQKQIYYNQYIEQGIPSYQERLKILNEIDEWTTFDEENINSLKMIIIDNEKNIPTLSVRNKVIPEQQEYLKQIVKDKKRELSEALIKKRQIVGGTAEEFAERDALNFMIVKGLYYDKGYKKLFNSIEEFLTLNDEDADNYIMSMDESLTKFTENTIRKIASMPFFINMFSYVKDDVPSFLKKAMVDVTNYQFMLISLGTRNLNILKQSEGEPPEVISDSDIDILTNWYDQNYSIILGKQHPTNLNENRILFSR